MIFGFPRLIDKVLVYLGIPSLCDILLHPFIALIALIAFYFILIGKLAKTLNKLVHSFKGLPLNWPMIITTIYTYFWMYSFGTIFLYTYGNTMSTLTAIKGAICVGALEVLHDHLSCVFFPHIIAKAKQNYKLTRMCVFDIAKLYAFYSAAFYFMCSFSQLNMDWHGTSTLLTISLEYWGIMLIRDFGWMKYVHRLLHEKEGLYKLHKRHHLSREDIQVLTSFHFDLLDVFIENAVAPIALSCLKYVITGNHSVHYLSHAFAGFSD